jgi:hypothetical protein
MNIMTSAGYKSSQITKDHGKCASQGYMMSPKDWRNFEATVYFKWVSGPDDQMVLYGRGGTHTGNHGCEGFSYKCDIQLGNGQTRFAKEQWHVDYHFSDWKDKLNIGNCKNKFIGMKLIIYNISGNKNVKLELWVDKKDNNTWEKADEIVDDGNWPDNANNDDCGGKKNEIGTWGGPYVTMRLDGSEILFKKFSVREIDINATDPNPEPNPEPECPPGQHREGGICIPNLPEPNPPPSGPPGSPPPPPVPNPFPTPPPVGTQLFANLVGVYNINFEETNGCSGLLVDKNPLKVEYNVKLDEDLNNPNSYQPLGNGSVQKCGQHFFSNQSNMKGKIFKRVSLFLSKVGTPTGIITVYIRNGVFDDTRALMGTIDASSLTLGPVLYDFENIDNTYIIDNDDRLSIEYAGGNSTNYVKVSKNSSDPEDGSNSRFFRFETVNYIPMAADDLAGVFYVEQSDEETVPTPPPPPGPIPDPNPPPSPPPGPPPPSGGGMLDDNGIIWLTASGDITTCPQTRNRPNDNRWSKNFKDLRDYGYEAVAYLTFSGVTTGKGGGHMALKHWGGNHTPPCGGSSGSGYSEGGSCCCWYDTGIRDNGDVQLQIERPHPNNDNFSASTFMNNIGKKMDGNTIGLKWLVYPITVGGSADNNKGLGGGIRLKMWVDTDPFVNGKPVNNWRPVYSILDTGQILGNYNLGNEMEVEMRNSDTKTTHDYAGGLHVRKRLSGDGT